MEPEQGKGPRRNRISYDDSMGILRVGGRLRQANLSPNPSPSRSIHFGGVLEASGREMPRPK